MNRESKRLEDMLWQSMLADVEAFKPGNVGWHGPGHGMEASMFVKSAEIAAPIIARRDCRPSENILAAATATMQTVGCNTNLGIILLCAPLAAAMHALEGDAGMVALRVALARVLHDMDAADGSRIYDAIRISSPGGLGSSDQYDVGGSDGGEIQAAMYYARHRDRIALQYCSAFTDVFTCGQPCLSFFHRVWGDMAGALSACYIKLLCSFADSHIRRSHGEYAAGMVQSEACTLWQRLTPAGPPAGSELSLWHDLDSRCKKQGLNPGTTADLSVASMFVELWLISS